MVTEHHHINVCAVVFRDGAGTTDGLGSRCGEFASGVFGQYQYLAHIIVLLSLRPGRGFSAR
jgi:hypothetical protein